MARPNEPDYPAPPDHPAALGPEPPKLRTRTSRKYRPSVFVRRPLTGKGGRRMRTQVTHFRFRPAELAKMDELAAADYFPSRRDLIARALDIYCNLSPLQRYRIRQYQVALRAGLLDPYVPKRKPGRPRKFSQPYRQPPAHMWDAPRCRIVLDEACMPGIEGIEGIEEPKTEDNEPASSHPHQQFDCADHQEHQNHNPEDGRHPPGDGDSGGLD